MYDLTNKIAIITGGAQGIGLATAEKLAARNARCILWDINEEKGTQAISNLAQKGIDAVFDTVDVSNFESVSLATARVEKQFGHIDILINNAGITRDARLLKMTPEQWQQVIDINLTGVFNCTKAVAEIMVKNNFGRIISASSVVGVYGNFGQTNYVAAKAGIIGMTKVWAREFGKKGITVNAVAPGFIATDMIKTVPEKVIESIEEKTPMGRLGSADDIANAYLFLASDEASFITGQVLGIDGGLIL